MTVFAVLLGIAFGSFLNVLIARVPQGESIVSPASHCPVCKNTLKWYHNIPLVSFIVLRGECAYCKTKISLRYPLVELATGVIFAAVFLKSPNIFYALCASVSFSLLLALSAIDIKYKAVPDSINLTAFSFAAASSLFYAPMPTFINLLHCFEAVKSAFLLAGFFVMLRFALSFALRRESLGEADIVVVASLGALLGSQSGFFAVFVGAFVSLIPAFIYRKQGVVQIPFIPFLALGGFAVFMLKEQLWFMR